MFEVVRIFVFVSTFANSEMLALNPLNKQAIFRGLLASGAERCRKYDRGVRAGFAMRFRGKRAASAAHFSAPPEKNFARGWVKFAEYGSAEDS